MCSVRTSPIPSAPKSLAKRASATVSAFARTCIVRYSSDQDIKVLKAPVTLGTVVGTSPRRTSPVLPSMVSFCPFSTTMSPTLNFPATSSISKCPATNQSNLRFEVSQSFDQKSLVFKETLSCCPAPATQGRPMLRATTAAWLVMPPHVVRIPEQPSNSAVHSLSTCCFHVRTLASSALALVKGQAWPSAA